MKYTTLLLWAVILCLHKPTTTFCQPTTPEMDSMRAVWEDVSQHDTVRLNAANAFLAQQAKRHRPDTAISQGMYDLATEKELWKYAIKALNFQAGASFFVMNFELAEKQVYQRVELAEKHGKPEDIADAYISLGQIAQMKRDFAGAIKLGKQAIDILGDATTGNVSWANYMQGLNYLQLKNYDSTHYYFDIAIQHADKNQNHSVATELYTEMLTQMNKAGDCPGARDFGYRAVRHAAAIKDTFGTGRFYMELGRAHACMGHHDSAKLDYTLALPSFVAVKNKQWEHHARWYRSTKLRDEENYTEAVEELMKCIEISEEMQVWHMLASDYLYLAEILIQQDRPVRAREFTLQALDRMEGLKNLQDYWSWANHILGTTYASELGTGEDSLALIHFTKALDYAEQMPRESPYRMANALLGIGDVHSVYPYDEPEIDKAIEAYERAVGYARRIRAPEGFVKANYKLGGAYLAKGNSASALKHCTTAYEVGSKRGPVIVTADACHCIYQVHRRDGDYRKALDFFELYHVLKDSTELEESQEMIVQFELEKQRLADSIVAVQERAELEMAYQEEVTQKEGQRNTYLVGGLGVLLLSAFLGTRLQLSRNRRKMLETEKDQEHAEAVRLQELDQLKTDLYTNITHEFRTPLTVISGMAAELKEHPTKTGDISTIIQRNSSILLNLVNQMLDLTKVESGKLEVNTVSGDVIEYIGYITQSFQSMAATKDITLHVLNKDHSLTMDYDPDKLMQVLSNLLSNSIKFTPGGGNIYVTTSANGALEMEVRDTGIGIPEANLPHIFDRFYQVTDTEHKTLVGTGIGLALTKQLVELMGGSIEVSSTKGKGTVFYVSLPITQETAEEDPVDFNPDSVREVAAVYAASTISQKPVAAVVPSLKVMPRLLLIEDNPDVQHFLQTILENDYKLSLAADGKQGVDTAFETIPDIIITDVMMPEKDGYQVCDELKSNERTNHIPIVMLTAKADAGSRIEGLKKGADAYLAKPFDKEELLVRLAKLLELRQTLQARYTSGEPVEIQEPTQELDEFIVKLNAFIHENMSRSDFNIAAICKEMIMSRSSLHKKVKALTGRSISLYVRLLRVQKAKVLLESTDMHVAEVGYEVGFADPAYFSKCFSDEYGVPPSTITRSGSI